jgi:hypothetical protein
MRGTGRSRLQRRGAVNEEGDRSLIAALEPTRSSKMPTAAKYDWQVPEVLRYFQNYGGNPVS